MLCRILSQCLPRDERGRGRSLSRVLSRRGRGVTEAGVEAFADVVGEPDEGEAEEAQVGEAQHAEDAEHEPLEGEAHPPEHFLTVIPCDVATTSQVWKYHIVLSERMRMDVCWKALCLSVLPWAWGATAPAVTIALDSACSLRPYVHLGTRVQFRFILQPQNLCPTTVSSSFT